jgi:hypothetical protein
MKTRQRTYHESRYQYVYRNGYLVQQRRKLGPHDHRGVEYYDRERMKRPLPPIVHPSGFDGYSAPPSWAGIPESWGEWKHPLPANYFHQSSGETNQPVDDLDAPPIAQTTDYTLERCHVETVCRCRNPEWYRPGQPEFIFRRAFYRWELTFADGAMFRFNSRAIAEAAIAVLLRIRKAKHPRPKYGKHSPENDCVFFANRRLQTLPADAVPALAAGITMDVSAECKTVCELVAIGAGRL